jgi:HlyD family secretion protein
MNDLVVLTAPEDGIVTEVAKRSVGSVLHEAEPLVTLVPTDAPLIAEVMIGSGDVGYTKTGDDVAIKVDAFPYQRHGLLQGHLRSVAEESVSPGTGGSVSPSSEGSGVFHRSQVTLTSDTLRMMPDGAHLIPGMTVTAEVKVGSRSVISYFLYPIRRGFGESIREP